MTTKSVLQAIKAEGPQEVQDSQVLEALKGFEVLGVVTPQYDCCVQKVIGEMAPYFKQLGIAPAMAFDADPRKLVDSNPDWVLYLRSGSKDRTPAQILANLEGHITYYRSLGLEVSYYLDDALFFMNNMAPLKLLWNCDRAIVATDALAEFLIEKQKFPKPIYVLKTHMDLPTFDRCMVPLYLTKPNKFNILFTSQGRVGALMIYRIMEYMDTHPEKYKNVNFIVVSAWVGQMRTILNKFRNVSKQYWEWMPLQEHYGLARAVQLILAPGEEADLEGQVQPELQHFWLHAKSCVKYTLAGAARIPIISTPLNEYAKAITHEKTGFLATDLMQWIKYIDLCVNDRGLCAQIGAAARADVEQNWHIFKRSQQWYDLLHGKKDLMVERAQPESNDIPAQLQLPLQGVPGTGTAECGKSNVPESGNPSN